MNSYTTNHTRASILLACLGLLLATCARGDQTVATRADASAAKGTTTGFWQEFHAPTTINRGQPRSGEQVYQYRCKGCHGRNTQGAPLPGDRAQWGRRAKQGMEVLMNHTLHGYRATLMPPRGGCENCSDTELEAAILYMMRAEPDSGLKQLRN